MDIFSEGQALLYMENILRRKIKNGELSNEEIFVMTNYLMKRKMECIGNGLDCIEKEFYEYKKKVEAQR